MPLTQKPPEGLLSYQEIMLREEDERARQARFKRIERERKIAAMPDFPVEFIGDRSAHPEGVEYEHGGRKYWFGPEWNDGLPAWTAMVGATFGMGLISGETAMFRRSSAKVDQSRRGEQQPQVKRGRFVVARDDTQADHRGIAS